MLWWTDDLKTGVDNIDIQHKTIFEKAHDIFDLGEEVEIKELKSVFVFFMDYATNHFIEEEALMSDYNYEDLEDHRSQHDYFMDKVRGLYSRLEEDEGSICEVLESIKVLTIEWLANHINGSDKKFVASMEK